MIFVIIAALLFSLVHSLPFIDRKNQIRTRFLLRKLSSFLSIVVMALLIFSPTKTWGKTINIVEVVPPDQSDYTVSGELRQIDKASDVALKKVKKLFPNCDLKLKKVIKRGNEAVLIETISSLAKSAKLGDEIIVGLSRSSFARVAAKASVGTHLEAISIGASTTQLATINPNFLSIVSPWQFQWQALKEVFASDGCKNPLGYFDPMDHLSTNFKNSFESDFGKVKSRDLSSFMVDDLKNEKCAFIAVSFSTAQPVISKIVRENNKFLVYGIGDWNYYSSEVKKILSSATKPKTVVKSPTGWDSKANSRSREFSQNILHEIGEVAQPVSAYTYDATLLGAYRLCENTKINTSHLPKVSKLQLLRDYTGIASSGNLESKMFIVEFSGKDVK